MTTQTDLTAVTTAAENIYRQSGPAATQLGAVITALQEDPPNVALALSEAQGAVTNVAYLAFQSAVLNEAAASLNTDLNPPPPPPQPLVVGETGSLVATVGIATTLATISVAGGTTPYKYAEDAKFPLPAGLAINGNVLSGTPTVAGSTEVQVDVIDSGGLSNSVAFTITVNPAITPPPPTTLPPLGFYGNGGSSSNATATAKILGVTAQGCSNYCDGTSWSTIGSSTWTKSDASPLAALTGVNLCPGAGNQKTGGLGQAAANASEFTNLAKSFNAKTDILRPGWEWDGNWFAWGEAYGGLNAGNSTAKYIADFQAAVTALRAGCPGIRIDWCGNSGSSTLAQLEADYPGDAYVDIIGFDHYDAGTQAANLAAVTPTIQFAALRGKPIGIGEWGAAGNGMDDPAFIDFMAMLINNPPLFSKTYNLPAYTVAYSSLFTDSSNNITNKPNMIAEFPKAFKGS